MVSFEIFVKAMPPSLSELKVLPSFCFDFKIPDDRAVTNIYPPKTSLTVHTLLCYYVLVSGFLLILQSLLDFLVSGIVFFMVLDGLSDHFTLTGVTN